MKTYFYVMVAGALGTGARMTLSNFFTERYSPTFCPSFPIGTLVVNVSGCLVIGLIAGLTGPEGLMTASPLTRQIVMIGFLGGYTTFSSFSLQAINLMSQGQSFHALLYVALSVLLCLAGAWLGLGIAAHLSSR